MPCAANFAIVGLVFWPGIALTTYLVAKHNKFGIRDAVLAAVGLKKYKRTFLINVALAGTILGSLGLMTWVIQTCQS